MKKLILILLVGIFSLAANAMAGEGLDSLISPGDLATSHAKYEGISNCTKCHRVGGGIPDKTCLDCHDKLAKKIQDKKGPHAKYTDPCVKCHSDHKGRKYKMIIIEEGKFDHDRTDYPLRDKHVQVKCDKCHKTEGIYTGLKQECVSCHKDEHKGQFRYKNDCEKCHNIKGWKDLARFDHNTAAAYNLKGKHIDVKCDKCHTKKVWKPLKSKNCLDCHKDEHKGQFKEKTCEACHTVDGWKKTSFDHNSPSYKGYKLEGKHIKTPCDKCHTKGAYKPLEHKRCLDCHKDEHKGQFKQKTCESCHDVNGWKKTSFDHNSPQYKGYKLEGKHIKTPCDKCHTQGKFKPIEHKRCLDCHKDEHKGQFKEKTCESCHTVNDWKKTSFDHNSPSYKGYRLEGKHIKTPCDKCHTQGKFKPIAYKKCLDCHKDEHRGQFKDKTCESCHMVDGWKKLFFNHNVAQYSSYALEGKHIKTPCDKCHVQGKYKPVTTICQSCHQKDDVHKKELGEVCKKCHTVAGWKPATLNHNQQTKFPLIGAHRTTDCAKCHKTKNVYKTNAQKCADCHKDVHKGKFKETCESCHTQFDWNPRKFDHRQKTGYELTGVHNGLICQNCHTTKDNYKLASRYCSQCHADTHQNQFGKVECSKCHTGNSWLANQFRHTDTGYPLQGAHRAADCGDCHKNRVYRSTPNLCYSCHQAKYAIAPYHVERGYSQNCAQCHDQNATAWNYRHASVTSNCESCHMKTRPATHVNNPASYPNVCEICHISTMTWTARKHTSATAGCSTCHMATRPATHVSNAAKYPSNCESCHKYPTWTFTHVAATANCSSCHMASRPASHVSNPMTYPNTCETCHTSISTWTARRHTTATTGCSTCHMSKRPATHTANTTKYPTTCESCHKYPVWTFTHVAVSANCSSCHLASRPATHLASPAAFPNTCEMCHISTLSWGSRRHTTATTGCSTCHMNKRPGTHSANPTKYPTTCESCHKYPTWTPTHPAVTNNCSACHMASKPATHVSNPATYPNTCELCHISTLSWGSRRHTTATTGCSTCHMNKRPGTHSANPTKYPTTCESCHKYPTWTPLHPAVTNNCSSCHLAQRPATHVNNPSAYPTTCEQCHTSTVSWASSKHTTATTGCSTCHLNTRPASHVSNPTKYPTTCEQCHKYPSWTFSHLSITVNCTSCHASVTPNPHKTYAARFGTVCEKCHKYPSWLPATFVHTFTQFPMSHKGYSRCSDCHPSQNYGNKGGCIECHNSRGAKVHQTNTNAGCLSCHPKGTK